MLNELYGQVAFFYSWATSKPNLSSILKEIKQLDTYKARKEYAEKELQHLSSGSSRITYLTDKKTVIKLAKNDKGIAQNKAEVNADNKIKSKYLNKVLNHAENFSWIEVNFLDKITAKEFKEMTDLNFEDFGEAIRYGLRSVSGNVDKEKPEHFEEVSKSKIYKEVKEIGKKLDLMPGDLARISSWGMKDNHPVLIDVGLTKKVFNDFYDDSSSSSSN